MGEKHYYPYISGNNFYTRARFYSMYEWSIFIYPQVETIASIYLHLCFDYQSTLPYSSAILRFPNRCDLTSNSEPPVLYKLRKHPCANLICLINYALNHKFHKPDTHDFTEYNEC